MKNIFESKKLFFTFLTLFLILFFTYNFIYSIFTNVTIEQLLFSLKTTEGTDTSVVVKGFIYVFSNIMIVYLILYNIKQFKLFEFKILFINIFMVFCFVLELIFVSDNIGLSYYLFNKDYSSLFEEKYINPKDVIINGSENTKNLIFIYVESLENTFMSVENGGAFNKSVIPNLEELALDNSGARMVYGTNFTTAGMIAATAGIPFNNLKLGNITDNISLNGAYTLGDVLKDKGYDNYLLMGSDSNFGGRKTYFKSHGDYNIYDYNYALDNGWIPLNYKVFWGYEDSKLFKFAKNNLKKISKGNKPFNYTILTVNTHFIDGYVENECMRPFKDKYLNAYHCEDELIGDFVAWVRKQDFYENTSIVIIGDHLTMQKNINDMMDYKDYDRTIYNIFINSSVNNANIKKRKFTTLDIYPTTIASLGFEIKGDRLGLGTNLFSSKKTLLEEYGIDYLNMEFKKKSKYYDKYISKST